MRVKDARAIARAWVEEEGQNTPDFQGAFLHGSINYLPDDAILAPTSDVDVMVTLANPEPPNKPGKFLYRDILLEVSYLSDSLIQSPERVLSSYHLAGSFWKPSILLDPSGQLTHLHAIVAQNFARREWVARRCEDASSKALNMLGGINANAPFHAQVTSCFFAAGVTTHVLLVAGLKNPTVRRRYEAVRELLREYGQQNFYPTLLALQGCAEMNQARAMQHLDALAEAFDAASALIRSPFVFAADISPQSRPVAIDGSRELIERGLHREAIFWMVATYSRCQAVFFQDSTADIQEQYSLGYRRLLADLGITSFATLQQRGEQIRQTLPRVQETAAAILAANPEMEADADKIEEAGC